MKFSQLALYLERLEKTSSRLEITGILAELFKKSDPGEIDKTTYLVLGILAPNYKGIVFNLAEKLMIGVLSRAYGLDKKEVNKMFKTEGDLGNLAANLAVTAGIGGRDLEYSVTQVYEILYGIALDDGEGSVERKLVKTSDLLKQVDPKSARYIARIPVGKLRLGFSDKTILDALSWMESGSKSEKPLLEKAFQVVPDVGMLASEVKKYGIEKAVGNIKPIVGVPVLPMLAQRLKSPADMIEKMGKVFVEPKFDGLRVLIHFKRGKSKAESDSVKAFTRNLNDVTRMFPELQKVGDFLKCDEAILDTEAVGMDPQMKRLLDFQTTMKRRRVHDIATTSQKIPLGFQAFDIILCDNESLMDSPYFERRKKLEDIVKQNNKLLVVDKTLLTTDPEDINREYRKYIENGLEGVIVKKFDAKYVPGRTGWRWVKMKQEEEAVGKLSDTLDCVVMGYTVGKGKRATFGLGQFLVGITDKDQILTLTKVGTGLSDEEFRNYRKLLEKERVSEKPAQFLVHKNYTPDFWVNPKFIVELAGDDLTESPIHTSGYALRFPRLVKFRDDKGLSEATTLSETRSLFKLQKSK